MRDAVRLSTGANTVLRDLAAQLYFHALA